MWKQPLVFSKDVGNLSYSFICLGARCCVSPTCSAPFRTSRRRCLANNFVEWRLDGIVVRKAYPEVPPTVEYSLTAWGQGRCPALDAILQWANLRQKM